MTFCSCGGRPSLRSCYVGVSSYNEKFRWGYVRSEMSCREKSFVNFLSSDYCHSNYCWIQSQFFNKNVPGTSTSPTKELLTEEFHRVNLIVRLFPGFAGLQSKIVASHSTNFSVVHHSSPKVRNDSDKIIWAKRAKPTISTFSIMLLFQSIGQQLVRVVDDVDFSAFSRVTY